MDSRCRQSDCVGDPPGQWTAGVGSLTVLGTHLSGRQQVSGDVQHVVDPAGDPEVAVLIPPRAVARAVEAVELLEVGGLEPLVVSVHGAHDAGPGPAEHQVALPRAADLGALFVQQRRLDAEEGPAGRAGFGGRGARQRGDHVTARLRLPERVDHGAAGVAHHTVVPQPRLRIYGLPD